jgi:preprotein translocase subunit SecD
MLRRTVTALAAMVFCGLTAAAADPVKVEVRRAETKAAAGLTEATVAGTNDKVYLYADTVVGNDDVASARVTEDDAKNPAVEVTFTAEGQKKMAKATEMHLGKPLAILVDGKVVAALVVRAKLGEKALITGKFTKQEAEKLAQGLKPQ